MALSPSAAFFAGDVAASAVAHDVKAASADAPEVHGGVGSDFIKSLIFGGVDGVITTFSTIASVQGGALPVSTVVVLGFANLIADAIAMGVGDFLSSKAEWAHLKTGLDEHEASFAADPAAIKAKVARELVSKGFTPEDATELVDILAQHKDFFIEYVMSEHENEELPGDAWGPAKDGIVTFFSFLVFGSVAMWVYVIALSAKYRDADGILGISAAATVLSLFALGVIQGHVSKQNRIRAWQGCALCGAHRKCRRLTPTPSPP